MRRAKIGDVYYMKVPNGYKIYQWAYRIPKEGDYIRVFDGLYNELPDKEYIEKLVKTEHSYIINFNAARAYRTELAFLIDNYLVPEEYPFPDYMLSIHNIDNNIYKYEFNCVSDWNEGDRFFIRNINELPKKYKKIKLLNVYLPASWIMYLFDIGFEISKPWLLDPEAPWDKSLMKYQKNVDKALEKERLKRLKK